MSIKCRLLRQRMRRDNLALPNERVLVGQMMSTDKMASQKNRKLWNQKKQGSMLAWIRS
ncbi:MAG: hypothetical protein FWC56_05150 [Phycisphaerae bacterium]|nr:hypothetical protein [Phycisphaerae bacterium]